MTPPIDPPTIDPAPAVLDGHTALVARLQQQHAEEVAAKDAIIARLRANIANPATDGCAICETDHRRVLIDRLTAQRSSAENRARELEQEVERLKVENDQWLEMSVRSSAHLGKQQGESNDEAAERVAQERDSALARVADAETRTAEAIAAWLQRRALILVSEGNSHGASLVAVVEAIRAGHWRTK